MYCNASGTILLSLAPFLIGDCLLTEDTTLLKYLHFLFLDLMTTERTIYEPLFLIDEDCNLSLKEKGRLALKLKETFVFLELLYCISVMDSTRRKMSLDPRENKTLLSALSLFLNPVCVCVCVCVLVLVAE
ncbi:hypothetical protein XENORESO_002787 [Xenotaenia resolanae]|uniref:Uncharacterized protein n=1 Tax=Xenotaenia resolanae TaxID=208358 RepID=A0ABV0VXT9_9TELE